MPYKLESVVKPSEDIVFNEVGGRIIAVHPFEDQSHEFDEVGSFIWRGIIGEYSLGEILRQILEGYDVENDEAETDLFNFISELEAKGLLEQVSES